MALLPTVMSLFGGKAPAPAAPSTAVVATPAATSQVANPTVPSAATPQSNGSVPAIPAAGVGDASPLSNFADLWKVDPNAPAQQPTTLLPSTFNLDPQKIREQAAKIDFTSHIPAENFTKALGGDVAALRDIVNQAAQFGFANATAASGELVRQTFGNAQTALTDKVLPTALRNHEISQALTEANPIFSDPAVAPMMNMLKQQLAAKYTTASAAEIAATATQYLDQMSGKIVAAKGGTVVPKGQSPGNQSGFATPQETDWSTFFGIPAT